GFDQIAYDQLLDVSSSFLETVQATALAAVIGATGDSQDRATAAAVGQAAQIVWLDGYFGGLLDGTEPFEVPSFE
ncbi:MAG: hypothetical protein IH965_11310, partial [Gemmatimonadetes bacterium]|nr:hypothetical protein [Gemmatimonadota bacterium]